MDKKKNSSSANRRSKRSMKKKAKAARASKTAVVVLDNQRVPPTRYQCNEIVDLQKQKKSTDLIEQQLLEHQCAEQQRLQMFVEQRDQAKEEEKCRLLAVKQKEEEHPKKNANQCEMQTDEMSKIANEAAKREAMPNKPKQTRQILRTDIKIGDWEFLLPPNKMTHNERYFFKDFVCMGESGIDCYLEVRNCVLRSWFSNPRQQLSYDPEAWKHIEAVYLSDSICLPQRIIWYLEKNGYINYGCIQLNRSLHYQRPFRVIIIGAGIAGLAAARQLRNLGIDPIILEARGRPGGRIWTAGNHEIGAFVMPGMYRNPLTVLAFQLGLTLENGTDNFQLYGSKGPLSPQMKLNAVERVLRRFVESSGYNWQEDQRKLNRDKHLYRADVYDFLHKVDVNRERQLRTKKLLEYCVAILDQLMDNKYAKCKEAMERSRQQQENKGKEQNPKLEKEPHHCSTCDLRELLEEFQYTVDYSEHIVRKVANNDDISSIKSFDAERAKTDVGSNCDTEDEVRLRGTFATIRNGFSLMAEGLGAALDIRYRNAVKIINYTANGVKIIAEETRNSGRIIVTHQADAVLCTLPLGVLQKSTKTYEKPVANCVTFQPPLPKWKVKAIHRIHVSHVIKIMLHFRNAFWSPNQKLFGYVGRTPISQGGIVLFQSNFNSLAVTVSGREETLNMHDKELIKCCLDILSSMFGNITLPNLKYSVIRWRQDPLSYGSHSFLPPNSMAINYDLLADPIVPMNLHSKVAMGIPRLFFAGEHTHRTFPSSVHGAFLSGIREVGRLLEYFHDIIE